MKYRQFNVPLIFAVALALAVPLVLAQQPAGPCKSWMRYNPATEATLQGTIREIKQQSGRRSGTGTHLALQTEQGLVEAHVGPNFFLKDQQLSFAVGDQIVLTGSRVRLADTEVLLVREVKKGEKVFTLRNAQGRPMWAGGNRP